MSTWLANLKAGDTVVRKFMRWYADVEVESEQSVVRVTDTLVILDNGEKFNRETGHIRPKPHRGHCRIEDPLEKERIRLLAAIFRMGHHSWDQRPWEKEPIDKLRRIVAIIEEVDAPAEGTT